MDYLDLFYSTSIYALINIEKTFFVSNFEIRTFNVYRDLVRFYVIIYGFTLRHLHNAFIEGQLNLLTVN